MAKNTAEKLRFLTPELVSALAHKYGTPLYVNSQAAFEQQVKNIQDIHTVTQLNIRYAMKANHNDEVLKIIRSMGVWIDASSAYEAEHALKLGFDPAHILLTAQELPQDITHLTSRGVQFNATSLTQLERYGRSHAGSNVSVRINPGVGSGLSRKVTTAGVNAGFGIWHEYLDQILEIAARYGLTIERMHTHIGAGSDIEVWKQVVDINLDLLNKLPTVKILNVGGGFKVARMSNEKSTDMQAALAALDSRIVDYSHRTGRSISVEIEPGTYIAANSAAIITQVIDIVDTGSAGHVFLRTNTGMNDIMRPAMYGAQHPLIAVTQKGTLNTNLNEYIVIGHCCESSDVITVAPGDSEQIEPRLMGHVEIGDYIVIEGCGAYCASMSAKGYNGFPITKEIMI